VVQNTGGCPVWAALALLIGSPSYLSFRLGSPRYPTPSQRCLASTFPSQRPFGACNLLNDQQSCGKGLGRDREDHRRAFLPASFY